MYPNWYFCVKKSGDPVLELTLAFKARLLLNVRFLFFFLFSFMYCPSMHALTMNIELQSIQLYVRTCNEPYTFAGQPLKPVSYDSRLA
jgi:hypothetical protein